MLQRFPRPAVALVAAGAAVISVCLSGASASAVTIRRSEWWLSKLDISTAWTISQGSGVTVAVLSDGVDTSQPDLAGKNVVTTAPAPSGAPTASGQFLAQQGTAIASLIAGRGHGPGGRSGILGVAPLSHILSIPVTLPPGDPALDDATTAAGIPNAIAAGIMYAVKHGATVIDLPLDPGQPDANGVGGDPAAAGGSAQEKAAVSYAISHNVVLVAPAGDDKSTTDAPNFPAAYPGVIAVGAFNRNFVKAPFSSHDSYVALTAAGAGMIAAANTGGYQTISSTSAASAVVAGIVALIRARYPTLNVSQVRKALISSTVFRPPGGMTDGSGHGTVDASRALAAAALIATPASGLAGARAQAAAKPATVAAGVTKAALGPQLIRAGEISGGLLVVLLLLVIWYATARRRRVNRTRAATATADWAHRSGQSRYPQAKPAGELDYFAATLSAAGQPQFADGRAGGDGVGLQPWAMAGNPDDSGGLPAIGAASRAVSRRPSVSGSPPWEPAPPPPSELPWPAASELAPADGPAPTAAGPASAAGRSGAAGFSPAQPDPARTPARAWADTPAAQGSQPAPPAGRSIWGSALSARGQGRVVSGLGEPVVRQPGGSAQSGPHGTEDLPPQQQVPGSQPRRPQRPSTLAPWDSPPSSAQSTGATASLPRPAGAGSAADWASHAVRPRVSGLPGSVDPIPRLLERGDAADQPGVGASTWREAAARPARPAPPDWDQAGASGSPGSPRVTAAGLPVRQPRNVNVSAAPLSPSGSLWEPAVKKTAERPQADYPAGSHERRDSD